ncbi:hypothetical protein CC2G_006652 [Coprinopsis cinerea AmutBmut pab1-1]|nr:hypothetical protein CC2G_006652 [Coprinopsis cinerea AmutBmut pab1-1]
MAPDGDPIDVVSPILGQPDPYPASSAAAIEGGFYEEFPVVEQALEWDPTARSVVGAPHSIASHPPQVPVGRRLQRVQRTCAPAELAM